MSPREQSVSAFTGVALMKESNHCTLHALKRLPALLHLNVLLSSLNCYLLPHEERCYFADTVNSTDDKFCKGSQQLDLSAPAAQLNTLTGNLLKHRIDNGAQFYDIVQRHHRSMCCLSEINSLA